MYLCIGFHLVESVVAKCVSSEEVKTSYLFSFEHWFVGAVRKCDIIILETQFASFPHELEGWNQFLSSFRYVQYILAGIYVLVVEASYHHCAGLS